MNDLSVESGKYQTTCSVALRFLRRMTFGIVALGALLWFLARTEYTHYQGGIESSRATGLAAMTQRSLYTPMLWKGAAPQMGLDQVAVVRHGTLIARTAALRISVRNFSEARNSVDRIVKAQNGYMASMTFSSPKDASQTFSADVAVPAAQCDAAVEEFKKLGRVDEERQGSEEVTAQAADLDIRLMNARETETRLVNLLRMGTGKVSDVLEVEKEMARVREEIERMEAEQKHSNNRVAFASINLTLIGEYQAQFGLAPSSIGPQIRNALVNGYRAAEAGLLSALVFFFSVGPSLVVWGLVLLWPVRWGWRQ